MRLPVLALTAALLLAGCSDSSEPTAPPTAPPTSASPQASATDPFEAIAPPTSLEVGSFAAVLANRGYAATRGYLALQLLEAPTVLGKNGPELVSQLTGARRDTTVARDVGGAPTAEGLELRPLFPQGATVGDPVASVTRSSYVAEEVRGQAGEQGLRITWTGSLTYPVTLAGTTSEVTYDLSVGYVYGKVANDPLGLPLQQVVRGTSKAGGVITACLAKGVLYPGPATAACPLTR